MIISNGNPPPMIQRQILNTASLAASPSMAAPKAPSSLNAPILS